VAEQAVGQAAALAAITAKYASMARLMARNAGLERQLLGGAESCSVDLFDESAEGRRWDSAQSKVEAAHRDLKQLARAAGFNPKAPLGRA
jgi:hypothetical protein